MVPHGDSLPRADFCKNSNISKPPKLSYEHLQRTISDISFELTTKEVIDDLKLAPISEVEDAKCECCGMCEECTQEYINLMRDKFFGKFVCGLCSEAVKEELEKNGGKKEDALSAHISACVSFNKYGRAFPVLFQAQAMKEMLKKSTEDCRIRAKSISPRDKEGLKKGLISRSSSCISAFTKELNDIKIAN
ncbi:hypothetical protein TanjilG_00145 [Lupinus angustifolius]|uniref:DUF1677 family protein n=1 Tax=Lupinus angustifolius TaxID=3871 RepID=A0A394D1E9_LUPAN|nr:PREDICTED: uncharacterized protein LOC109336935 [Lupinus angustifolius]OIW16955.1 hypothetical protein TanjilG_00145 [Lupinus angustifolius]